MAYYGQLSEGDKLKMLRIDNGFEFVQRSLMSFV